MLKSSPPPRFPIAFAASAGGGFIRPIPQASQIGINPGFASLTDGFVPLNGQPVASGGIPPFEADMNGILNQISLWCQWLEAGGGIYYDATFATTGSGGYPQGAIVQSNVVPGDFWMSTADNNTTDPDSTSAANWVPDPGRIAPGTPVPSFSSTVPTGFVAANTLTIGNALSNATGRAGPDTLLLYSAIWLRFQNSFCPIFTSGGAPSTRGANPDADFNANKALQTPDMRGLGIIGADTMGGPNTTRFIGVPFSTGSSTLPGSICGENVHGLLTAELSIHAHANTLTDLTHTHSYSVGSGNNGTGGGGFTAVAGIVGSTTGNNNSTPMSISNANAGSGTPHNTVQSSITVYWNLKL